MPQYCCCKPEVVELRIASSFIYQITTIKEIGDGALIDCAGSDKTVG
jgi:hypothetical protein